jgi:hypothetical protein
MPSYFENPTLLKGYTFPGSSGIDYSQTPEADLGGYLPSLNNLGSPNAPSPAQPGKTAGWDEQAGAFLEGLGKFGRGLGAGIAAARGMPMAGMMLGDYYEGKTGDKDQSEESSIAKALKALQSAGIISSVPQMLEPSYTDLEGAKLQPSRGGVLL